MTLMTIEEWEFSKQQLIQANLRRLEEKIAREKAAEAAKEASEVIDCVDRGDGVFVPENNNAQGPIIGPGGGRSDGL